MPDKLNIGAFCCLYGMGGAQNSVVTLSNELTRRGHRLTLYCPANEMFSHVRPMFEMVDVPVNRWDPGHLRNITVSNMLKVNRQVRRRRHDILVSFTSPSIMMTTPLALRMNLPCVQYVLGPARTKLLRAHPGTIIANAVETRALLAIVCRRREADIPVLRGRVAVDVLDDAHAAALGHENPYTPLEGMRQVAMMCTWHANKLPAVLQAVEAVKLLAIQRDDFRFVLAGEGPERPRIESLFAQINRRFGRDVVRSVGYVGDVAKFLSVADIAMGIGRCAFEAMAMSKPTLVVGNLGFAGIVCEEEIDQLAYYNFAGRNITDACPPVRLSSVLDEILSDVERRSTLGQFGRRYVMKHLSGASGAAQLERIMLEEISRFHRPLAARFRVWGSYTLHGGIWAARGIGKRLVRPKRAETEFAKIDRVRRAGQQYCLTNSLSPVS